MEEVFSVVLFIIAAICFGISILQFFQKGFLLNNEWIYSSKEERKNINKKPYYIQSGVCFLIIGIIFSLNGLEIILKTGRLSYIAQALAMVAIVYAVVSAAVISKRK